MPKMKTKSSAKKRFRLTASGKVLMGPANKQHNMRKRPKKMLRKARGMKVMCPENAKMIKQIMPYA